MAELGSACGARALAATAVTGCARRGSQGGTTAQAGVGRVSRGRPACGAWSSALLELSVEEGERREKEERRRRREKGKKEKKKEKKRRE